MDNESKKKTPKQQPAEEPVSDSADAQSTLEHGAEILGKAEEAVSDAYDKTARTVGETYEHAKSYSGNNPGKALLITLGIGVGLGFLLGKNSRRMSAGRFARPVVNALSDIALEFFG